MYIHAHVHVHVYRNWVLYYIEDHNNMTCYLTVHVISANPNYMYNVHVHTYMYNVHVHTYMYMYM